MALVNVTNMVCRMLRWANDTKERSSHIIVPTNYLVRSGQPNHLFESFSVRDYI